MQLIAALGGKRETNQTAAVSGHEVNGFGSNQFGGHSKIAFIFAIFVVDYYHHFPSTELD